MKKFTALALLSFMILSAFGQVPGNFRRNGQGSQMTGSFYGKVVDANKKGIEAASVTLVQNKFDSVTKKPKEVIVGGMLTSNKGDFSIENVPVFGRYTLKVTGIGYKAYSKQVSFDMPNRNAIANANS